MAAISSLDVRHPARLVGAIGLLSRDVAQPASSDDPDQSLPSGEVPPRVVLIERPTERRGPWTLLLGGLAGLSLVLVIAILATMLLVGLSLLGVGRELTGGIERMGQVVEGTGTVVEQARQAVLDRLDPASPPRGLTHDAEFVSLQTVRVGEELPRTGDYVLNLVEIKKRPGAASRDEAQYAVVRRRLETPRETRILGQVIRTDDDAADYVLYKGESLRVAQRFYKVNWVSFEEQAMAIARYRSPDDATPVLKLEVD